MPTSPPSCRRVRLPKSPRQCPDALIIMGSKAKCSMFDAPCAGLVLWCMRRKRVRCHVIPASHQMEHACILGSEGLEEKCRRLRT